MLSRRLMKIQNQFCQLNVHESSSTRTHLQLVFTADLKCQLRHFQKYPLTILLYKTLTQKHGLVPFLPLLLGGMLQLTLQMKYHCCPWPRDLGWQCYQGKPGWHQRGQRMQGKIEGELRKSTLRTASRQNQLHLHPSF